MVIFVQHQYEDAYWRRQEEWDYFDASMYGSSFLKLPKLFQLRTGNIGIHHIHHLSHQIPNYKLRQAYEENEIFQKCKVLTFSESFKGIKYKLWDEEQGKLITFREFNQYYGEQPDSIFKAVFNYLMPWMKIAS